MYLILLEMCEYSAIYEWENLPRTLAMVAESHASAPK